MMHGLGNMHNGTNGMPAGVKMPRKRPAMWFDGVDDYVQCDNVFTFGWTWSLSFWIFPLLSASDIGMLSIGDNMFVRTSATNRLHLYFFYRQVVDGYVFNVSMPLLSLTWTHVVLALSAGNLKIFKDGELVNDVTTAGTLRGIGTLASCTLGTFLTLQKFNGTYQDVIIYNTTLSQARAAAIYNGGYVRRQLDLSDAALAWRINTADYGHDSSGNNKHGTVYGSPERCLVHRRGHVIRGNPPNRYVVR